jgi:hypothetical protein
VPAQPAGPAAAARTIYAFLIASTAIVSIGAYVVHRALAAPATGGMSPFEYVALLLGLSDLMLVLVIRSRLPVRAEGMPADEWWRTNTGRAVLVWALLESPALIGSVALFATGHLGAYAALVFFALAGLATFTPARLAGD